MGEAKRDGKHIHSFDDIEETVDYGRGYNDDNKIYNEIYRQLV